MLTKLTAVTVVGTVAGAPLCPPKALRTQTPGGGAQLPWQQTLGPYWMPPSPW